MEKGDTSRVDPSSASEDLRQVRSRICDMMLMASAVVAGPAVVANMYRTVEIGMEWVLWAHMGCAVMLWALLIFRKSIPYAVRAGSIVALFLAVGLGGFWQFGMVSGANPLVLVVPVLATVLFGKRLGILCAAVLVIVMAITAYSFVYGGRVFNINFDVSDAFLPAWMTYTLTVILAVATSIAAISMSNRHLEAALIKARTSRNKLADLNRDLERQVLQRTLELEGAKKEAELQARTDVLTGLNNRRAFFEFAEVIDAQSRRYNHAYVIAMIDIDHFKAVNDTWGHDTGDIALKVIGQLISKELRETDVIGRIGGEEFAVVLPETPISEAMSLAERLRETIEMTAIKTPKGTINLTTSIGVAVFEDRKCTLDQVVANADAALYLAKNTGRNRVERHTLLYEEAIATAPVIRQTH